MTATTSNRPKIYDGDGDQLMAREGAGEAERCILVPDAPISKVPETRKRIRIMWGQHMLEDLLAGRYRSLVCAVNAQDNSRGIVSQLAALLPTSQWDKDSITVNASQFAGGPDRVKVLKFDMDVIEVLAILRPASRNHLTLNDLSHAFQVVSEMLQRKQGRTPSASVSFLDARANQLLDESGNQPSLETVLRIMHTGGYDGDVYPPPSMWAAGETGCFPRYPFPPVLDDMRGGF